MTAHAVRMHIPDSAWPGRTPALVQRDRDRYPGAVDDVVHDRFSGGGVIEIDPQNEEDVEPPELFDDALIAVLQSDEPARATAAAFVAGRCTTDDTAPDAGIKAAVQTLVDSVDTTTRLGARARVYVEAVMALALLGEESAAVERFTAQVTHPERRSTADHLAAGYLAQLGSPLGYPILLEDLNDKDSPHGRMVALEQVIAFLPYDGETVGKTVVDVRAALRRALRDKDDDVAIEAVRLIAEARLSDAEAMLRDAAGRPHSKEVRAAAKWTLEQLGLHSDR